MKKVAIRKLNRTQLAKAGTKQIYITGHFLLDFFGYKSINDLTVDDGTSHKKKFYKKSDYYHTPNPIPTWLSVTKATQEVRIAGFADLLPEGYSETDYVVMEAIEANNGEIIYLFDVVKHPNIFVLQRYHSDDDAANFTTFRDTKGKIRFQENPTVLERPDMLPP